MFQEEYSRLIKIDEILQRNDLPKLEDFLRECLDFCSSSLSPSTINRDLKKLRRDFGRKIIYDRKKKCYRYKEEYPYLSVQDFYLGH